MSALGLHVAPAIRFAAINRQPTKPPHTSEICVGGGANAPHKKRPPQPSQPGGHRPEPRGNGGCMPTNRNMTEKHSHSAREFKTESRRGTNIARGEKEHSMKSHLFPAYVLKPNQTQNSPGREPTLSPGLGNFPLAHLMKHKLMLRLFVSFISSPGIFMLQLLF